MASYQRINLVIDSSQRANTSETNTNFSVQLNNSYMVKLARFKSASIPMTYYNITSSNNFLRLMLSGGGSGIACLVPEGRWMIKDICAYIQNFMNTGLPNFTAAYYSYCGKVLLSNSGGALISLGTDTTIYGILGFDVSQLTNTPSGSNILADNCPSILDAEYITLTIDALSGSAVTINGNENNMTFLLPVNKDVNCDYFGMAPLIINSSDDSGQQNNIYDNAIKLGSFKVKLSDKNGVPLNLNNVDWWAVIELIVDITPPSGAGMPAVYSKPTVLPENQVPASYLLKAPEKPVPKFLWL